MKQPSFQILETSLKSTCASGIHVPLEVKLDKEGNPASAIIGDETCWLGLLEFLSGERDSDSKDNLMVKWNKRTRKFGIRPKGIPFIQKALYHPLNTQNG